MQISPVHGTYAYVMVAIKPIAINEEITVKYRQSGYYGQDCLCHSCTGVDTSDLSALKPNAREEHDKDLRDTEQQS
jgi:hypothetical protein